MFNIPDGTADGDFGANGNARGGSDDLKKGRVITVPNLGPLTVLNSNWFPFVLAQGMMGDGGEEVTTRISVATNCTQLESQVQVLYQQVVQLRTEIVRIESMFRQKQTQYAQLVRARERIRVNKGKLNTMIGTSELKISQFTAMKTKLESEQEMTTGCVEVETKQRQILEFHRYRSYPLEQRRRELLQWASEGESHNCESAVTPAVG